MDIDYNISMKDLHSIVAENLTTLRKSSGLTQAQIAERLNYSDKAVSRWERGDTMPDINVLYELCDFYGITLDALVQKGSSFEKNTVSVKDSKVYRIALSALDVAVVWLVATVLFVYGKSSTEALHPWMVFIWAVPASCVVLQVANRRHHGEFLMNFVLESVLNWTLLTSIYLQYISRNLWLIYIIGIPIQLALVLWYVVRKAN